MEDPYRFASLSAWIEYLRDQFEGMSVDAIAKTENIMIVYEPLLLSSYEWATIGGVTILSMNSALSSYDRREWLIGALAAKRLMDGRQLIIPVFPN